MRETTLTGGPEPGPLTVRTGDAGTLILDAEGRAIETHGTDRHEEMVDRRLAQGWQVAGDGDIRPPEANGGPPQAGGAEDAESHEVDGPAGLVKTDQDGG